VFLSAFLATRASGMATLQPSYWKRKGTYGSATKMVCQVEAFAVK